MSTTLKSLKEAMSARLRLAAALAREEQKRKDKDAARAAREAQQKAQQPKPPVKEAREPNGMTEEADMDKTITFKSFRASLQEKKLTPVEMKKREEVAKAIERENPKMPMGMKMAIATKTAKRVAEQAYMGKGNHRPGWMLKADPELAKKFKEKQDLYKAKVKAYGNPAAGKSIKEELGLDESVKTTHENPLVTVHDKDGLHTHANLSTANSIFNTNVKHTDVHKGPVHVTSGREDKNKLKFAISKHHAQAVKDEEKFKKEYGESVEDQHLCAKHVRSSLLGDGVVLEAQHAEPDEEGNIEWYMVEFKTGISKVYTEDLEIMIAEYHGNHKKKKRMTNG